MEIKNQTAYTYDCLMEFNRQHKRKLVAAITVIICACTALMLFYLGMRLFLLATGRGEPLDSSDVTASIFYLLLSLFLILYPPISRRLICRKQAAANTSVECIFTGEYFTEISTSNTVNERRECKYDVIVRVTESQNYFYLYINPNAAHIVDKRGFTEGTEGDFRILLRTVIDAKKLHIR